MRTRLSISVFTASHGVQQYSTGEHEPLTEHLVVMAVAAVVSAVAAAVVAAVVAVAVEAVAEQ